MICLRPDVTFGVDARWLLSRFENGKDFKRLTIWESFAAIWGTILPPGASLGGFKNGVQFWPAPFLRANSVLHQANDFSMSKIDEKPYFLPIPTLICNLSPKLEE